MAVFTLPPIPPNILDKTTLRQWLFEVAKKLETALDSGSTASDSQLLDGVDGSDYARTDIAETFTDALTVEGAFTSIGINDDATVERLALSDTTLKLGGGSGISYGFSRTDNTHQMSFSGGNGGSNTGGALDLYGSSHASTPGDFRLRSSNEVVVEWDESTGTITISTATGSKTVALIINSDQSNQPVSFRPPLETTTNLEDITHAINTAASKVQGTMVYNSTTDNPVYAVGNANDSVWVDGAGTTVHTPTA